MRYALVSVAIATCSWFVCFASVGCGTHSAAGAPGTDASLASGADGSLFQGAWDGGHLNIGPLAEQLDGGPDTSLPPLPPLTNVVVLQRPDSVGIDFDPVDNAVDYRVYPLPDDSDITVDADGGVVVQNAIYRCAGIRQTFDVANNFNNDGGLTPQSSNGTGLFTYDGNGYAWKTQISSTSPLGYVYATAAAGRLPVYALAGYTDENEVSWTETRLKIYTTSTTQHQTLVNQGWRDDGIVFYVPSAASSATATIYSSQTAEKVPGKSYTQYVQYYYTESSVAMHGKDTTPPAAAFQVLTAAAPGTEPLMAVFYEPLDNHVELVAGNARYNRAAYQGPGPLWHLEWSGITQPTTLVVEALASGCPFQGLLSPTHLDAAPHQTFFTLSDLQSASPTGEVFINGQYDGPKSPPPLAARPPGPTGDGGPPTILLPTPTMSPRAIARSFVSVAPQPPAATDWDWFQGFDVGTSFGAVTQLPKVAGDLQCPPSSQPLFCGRWQSPIFDFSAYNLDTVNNNSVQVFTYGFLLGQLWDVFDDLDSDVTGKIRFTALQKATVASDPTKFLHATMSVEMVDTDRRYPQLIISDQPAPVQEGLSNPNNNTLLFQSILGPGTRMELQAIHGLVQGKPWDVNNQAPEHIFVHPDFSALPNSLVEPDESPIDHIGMDRMTRFDVYVSSQVAYFFLDGVPAGCTQYPSGFTLGGSTDGGSGTPVTVTIGDVLYHEGASDEEVCGYEKPFPFMHEHQCTETRRHFDDFGFKSGVAAPAWNPAVFPCGSY